MGEGRKGEEGREACDIIAAVERPSRNLLFLVVRLFLASCRTKRVAVLMDCPYNKSPLSRLNRYFISRVFHHQTRAMLARRRSSRSRRVGTDNLRVRYARHVVWIEIAAAITTIVLPG